MNQNNKQMQWIWLLRQKINKYPAYKYTVYEIVSECRIPGLFTLKNLICGIIAEEIHTGGMFHYQIKIPNPSNDIDIKSEKNGYYFKTGIVGEIISLMALFFRCRFFILNRTSGKLSKISMPNRINYSLSYKELNPSFYHIYFENKNKNLTYLKSFFNKLKKLNSKYHQRFMLSCHLYAQALQEIGKDNELAYIKLVSAIESLSSVYIQLNKNEDPLDRKKFLDAMENLPLRDSEKQQIKSIFENRKIKQKFIKFVIKYSKGYFKGGNYKAKNLKIRKKQLPTILKHIYDARSGYLHSGEPMYISLLYRGHEKYDIDPSLGMIIDRCSISDSKKLPTIIFWEGLVRNCILNYLYDKNKYNSQMKNIQSG